MHCYNTTRHQLPTKYAAGLFIILVITLTIIFKFAEVYTPILPWTSNREVTVLLNIDQLLPHEGVSTQDTQFIFLKDHLRINRKLRKRPPDRYIPIMSSHRNTRSQGKPDFMDLDSFPPLSSEPGTNKKTKANSKTTPLAEDTEGKKMRPNGTTPTKSSLSRKDSVTSNQDQSKGNKEVIELNTIKYKKLDKTSAAATALAQKLDDALKKTDSTASVNPLPSEGAANPSVNAQDKTGLSFAIGTSFTNNTQSVKAKRSVKLSTTDQTTKITLTSSKETIPLYSEMTATAPTPTAKKVKTTTVPPPLYNDIAPQGKTPEPVKHNYSFAARVMITVPPCSQIQYKVMNLLAYAIHILRKTDPSATYLKIEDEEVQAGPFRNCRN
jgi:hypothetical protein